jgi:hypothetical protein
VLDDAHAFSLLAPAYGEVRPVTLPEPGRAIAWATYERRL